jgi:hypothetical protein
VIPSGYHRGYHKKKGENEGGGLGFREIGGRDFDERMSTPDVSKNEMLIGVGIPFFETTPKQTLENKHTPVTCHPTTLKKNEAFDILKIILKRRVLNLRTLIEKRERKKRVM